MKRVALLALLILAFLPGPVRLGAQEYDALSPSVREYVSMRAPLFAIRHVRVVDGTGGEVLEDQTVVVAEGRIKALGPAEDVEIPAGAEILEGRGKTLIPGMVGMHDHIFYPAGSGHYNTLEYSAPRLYLAACVTTIRTTGGMEPYTEMNLRDAIL